jgi:hypothetical protein
MVAYHVRKKCDVVVSVDTFKKVLNDAGLNLEVKEKKLMLTQKHIKDMFEFAKHHKYWTMYDREHVIFSGKKNVNQFCSDSCSWYWICNGQPCDLRHVQQIVKFGGDSVMLWRCMMS